MDSIYDYIWRDYIKRSSENSINQKQEFNKYVKQL